jgi:hypothetical protein
MNKPAKPKLGRPPLGKRRSLTFRIRDHVNDLLVAAAESSAVSVSEEIERRIEQSFSNAGVVSEMFGGAETARLLFTLSIAIQEVERATGKPWWADVSTSEQMRRAIDNILIAQMAKLPEMQKQIEEHLARYGRLADLASLASPEIRAEFERRPFIDHFQIGNEAAAFAMVKAQAELAVRNAPVKASELSQSSTRKAKGK